jgi:CDP-glycerol glycerophosphotransferase (TagB/SpsB family)
VTRVAFFAAFPFHAPILAPIRDAIGPRAETWLGGNRRALVAFAPHVVVMAASPHLEYFRHHLPGAFIVNVRHGLIGKQGLSRLPGRASARRFDAVCVGDPLRVAHYERVRARPDAFWETGYPQMDPLFRGDAPCVLPLDPRAPALLYAPTWNLGLSSADMLGARLVDLVRGHARELNIIIKPHPVIGDWRPRWMARWRRMAASHANVHLVEDTHADVVPYLAASDVLLSDASSVIFEYLALDRPIVLITNPRHRADPAWLGDDIVWRWRDLGHEISDVTERPAAVASALADPGARGERRRAYARTLFGRFTDGRNAERAVGHILDAAERVKLGKHAAAAPPPLAWRWHDLRTRLRHHPAVRRLAFGLFEHARLAWRARRVSSLAAPAVAESPHR